MVNIIKRSKKKYKVGMFGGKFMPFHKGHFYCIDVAAAQCEKVYVLLFSGGEQEKEILMQTPGESYLSAKDREKHIISAIRNYNNAEFHFIDITGCRNPDGTENWDMETPLVRAICGRMDAVYGSEPSYKAYFDRAYPEAEYILVDVKRKHYPISGTAIRNMENWKERKLWII